MQSLFPQHNSQQAAGEKPLLEFKAGKCAMVAQEEGDFLVSPEEKRGKVVIAKGEGYVYFRWVDRSTNQMDVNCNWIVFPNSVIYKKIDTGRAEDRVYLLKWKDENRRLMFWLQDKSDEKDEENCNQVNELFNNPAAVAAAVAAASQNSASAVTGGAGGGGGGGAQDWMRMLGLAPPPATESSAQQDEIRNPASTTNPPTETSNNSTQALDLARILADLGAGNSSTSGSSSVNSNTNAPPPSSNPTTTTSANSGGVTNSSNPSTLSATDLARAFASNSSVSSLGQRNNSLYNRNPTELNQVLSADAIIATGVLDDPSIRANLLQLLPEGQQSDEFLEVNLRSPQFQQALDALGSALSSENFNNVMANLGIDPAPGANWLMRGDFVAAFLVASNAAAASRREASSPQDQLSEEGTKNEEKMDES